MARVDEPDFDNVCGCICCDECPLEGISGGCICAVPCPTNMEEYAAACELAEKEAQR